MENAALRSHAAPRAGRHHVVPAAEECREGGPRTHTRAHAHSGRAASPHPPPTPSAAAGAECTGRAAASSPPARRMAPNCHPPAQPGHSLPRRHTPLVPPQAPSLASYFPPTPNWIPRTLAIRLPLKAEGPRDREGKAPNSMTRWVSSSPHSLRNRPLNAPSMAILPPNIIHLRTKLINF